MMQNRSKKYSGYLNDYSVVCASPEAYPELDYASKALTAALFDASGKQFEPILDNDASHASEKEILLGVTNRAESRAAMAALQTNAFSVEVVGSRLVIVGENPIALDKAIKYFVKNCLYGVRSIEEIHAYRERDPHSFVDLPKMNEYAYGESVCIYAGCIQQEFAIDFATGDFYYSLADQYCKTDAVLVRRTPTGHQEYMILSRFGHMETFDIERVGDKLYVWVCAEAATNHDNSAAICRFEWEGGTYHDWKYGQTWELGPTTCPSVDIANGYVTNWRWNFIDIYDRDRFLAGDTTKIHSVDITFPFYKAHGIKRAIGAGYDLCGSYLYTTWYAEKEAEEHTSFIYVIAQDMHGNVVSWDTVEYRPEGSEAYREINGLKVEMINGKPQVFICLSTNSAINNRYLSTVVAFAEQPLPLVTPTMKSLAQVKSVIHNKLPKNAAESDWKEEDGVISIHAVEEQRLMFDEAAFKGEAYTYETLMTMNGARVAGINLAGCANVSKKEALYKRNTYIGVQCLISDAGKFRIKAEEIDAEYDISVQASYALRADVTESGQLTVTVNGAEIAVLQLSNRYIGGHLGLWVEDGFASFENTKLTYHHP